MRLQGHVAVLFLFSYVFRADVSSLMNWGSVHITAVAVQVHWGEKTKGFGLPVALL